MKGLSKVVAALSVATLLAAPALRAQGAEFSLGGGIGFPLGDFNDVAKTGWHGLAAISFVPHGSPVGIQFDGQYQQFKLDAGSSSGLKDRILMGTANVVFKFKTSEESAFRPYLIGGGGVYNSKVTGSTSPGQVLPGGTTKFGLNGGVGFDFKTGGLGLFVEDRYHHIFTSGGSTSFMPISIGIRFGGD
jgi:hypothetical protein